MIDPPRLREGGTEAPAELKDLFRAAKKPEPLTPATDARLGAQVTALAALPATPLIKGLPWLIAAGAVVVAGALGLLAQRTPPLATAASPPATASSPPAVVVEAVAPAAPAPEIQPPAEKPRAPATSAGQAAPAEAASSSEDALAGEAQLLNQAHAAMASDPRKAHAFASAHAKRYPRGQLAAERELILVQALVKLGRVREAEARGRALRKSAPSSIYGQRLDTILKGQ
jgi:TolA-binding protein